MTGVQTYLAYIAKREPFFAHYDRLNAELIVHDNYRRGFEGTKNQTKNRSCSGFDEGNVGFTRGTIGS